MPINPPSKILLIIAANTIIATGVLDITLKVKIFTAENIYIFEHSNSITFTDSLPASSKKET